jgi:hypothetical protein
VWRKALTNDAGVTSGVPRQRRLVLITAYFLTTTFDFSITSRSSRLDDVRQKEILEGKASQNFNMAKDDKLADKFDDIPHERKDPRPDFSTPPPRKRLPQEIMDTLNDEEKLWEVLYEGKYVYHPSRHHHATPSNTPPNPSMR